jgi:hypothetical protein
MTQLGHYIGRESLYVLRQEIKMCENYNGWKNRETWATALWLDNEEGTQAGAQRIAELASDKRECADMLEEFVTEMLDMEAVFELDPASRKERIAMSSDIGSLYRVDWWEIAEHYLATLADIARVKLLLKTEQEVSA